MRILVLNGPNLNLLGEREPEIYGTLTLEQINAELAKHAEQVTPAVQPTGYAGVTIQLDFFQSNHEGTLVDKLHEVRDTHDVIIFNPAAFTHYSYALRDAIAAITIPVIEVHLSNPDQREDFRKSNVVREVCTAHFQGKGLQSYIDALDYTFVLDLSKKETTS
ncbi:MAG: 3-dehydroquinate dehydratase [Coriobacteriia bacterium]|nr:3-dehydroquinate dehydratase [Coriobacteriia bacterium]